MNFTFNYFRHKFPGKRQFGILTPEELTYTREHFPEDLFLFLEEEGYCSYGNGFFHFVNPADYREILSEWPKVPGEYQVFCRTGMGDLILWGEEQVHILHVHTGYFSTISESMFDFFKFSLGDTQYVDNVLYKKQFDQARQMLGELDQDECYSFVPALAMGGDESAENLHKMKIWDSLSLLSQL
ncbi:MAG: hypothetical protein K0S23_54 [Fluviicola sp.]|jgi:hypothetical protein|uniref:T6SS immunity protein Tdi1 domain-containing protein n=1 Tax=Fluviicola sp. TaxID=1917219 RepID=UPI00260FF563|nr:T6SS immunity protein Tdi1 domain-containing protein [Fluviicola sp.]MDF3025747.1 hypothetical protein [Fluviicola sp.]